MRGTSSILLLASALCCLSILPRAGWAQDGGPRYSIWDYAHRAQITWQAGALYYTKSGENPDWRGASLAGAATYSWHPRLSTYLVYEHGFPFQHTDGHVNDIRLCADLKVYPPPGVHSKFALGIGGGAMWQGENSVRRWRGSEAHLAGAYFLGSRFALAASYAHAFGATAADGDYEFIRGVGTGLVYP